MNNYNVYSEIGPLKTVLLNEPGYELENLTPNLLNDLLFDDIPWLPLAIKEHQAFAKAFTDNGVKVLYLSNLVSECLDLNKDIRQEFIEEFIKDACISSETLAYYTQRYLESIENSLTLVKKTMSGIRKNELPNYAIRTLSDHISDYPFATDPMPNLYFTRDPFSIIGNGVSLNKMKTITRTRETIYGKFILKYHPVYKNNNLFYNRDYKTSIEGGDIIILNKDIICVGVSERTHPASIEKLAKNIFKNSNFKYVLAFDLPKKRSFMHLDTVFTQVDYDKFTVHSQCTDSFKVYELSKNPNDDNKLIVREVFDKIENILSSYLKRKITLIKCGGEDVISSDREQWSDGANTLTISPGKVIVYDRNHITNNILKDNGIEIITIPSSELSRGRGGPRCMCMPLYRENLED